MNIWGIILLVVLVMSGIMISFGLWFSIAAPKRINLIFGYRTPMSMKNADTWHFGNVFAGKLMWRLGALLLACSLITLFVIMGDSTSIIRTAGIIIIIAHAVMIFGTVILTEVALHRNFDRHGNPKR